MQWEELSRLKEKEKGKMKTTKASDLESAIGLSTVGETHSEMIDRIMNSDPPPMIKFEDLRRNDDEI